jgi:hypothetical protein
MYFELKFQTFRELVKMEVDPNSLRLILKPIFSREFSCLPSDQVLKGRVLFYNPETVVKSIFFIDRVGRSGVLKLFKAIRVETSLNTDPIFKIQEVDDVFHQEYIQGQNATIYPNPEVYTETTYDDRFKFFNLVTEDSFTFTPQQTRNLAYRNVEWVGFDLGRRQWCMWLRVKEAKQSFKLLYYREIDIDQGPKLELSREIGPVSSSFKRKGRMFSFDKFAIQVVSSHCFYNFLTGKYIERSQETYLDTIYSPGSDNTLRLNSFKSKHTFMDILGYLMNLVFLDHNFVLKKL